MVLSGFFSLAQACTSPSKLKKYFMQVYDDYRVKLRLTVHGALWPWDWAVEMDHTKQ